jgi:hypothetical protein
MRLLRKFIAITLLTLLSLPFASALFALSPKNDAHVPACCRRDGKHHCMETMAAAAATLGDKMSTPMQKCPYCPGTVTAAHGQDLIYVSSAQAVFAHLDTPAAVVAQTESKRRISRDRSRQKRGPPSISLL